MLDGVGEEGQKGEAQRFIFGLREDLFKLIDDDYGALVTLMAEQRLHLRV